jgi:hypothetical protein
MEIMLESDIPTYAENKKNNSLLGMVLHESGILSGIENNEGHNPDIAECSDVFIDANVTLFFRFTGKR